MPVPKSVTKINKDGVQFVSSVDRVSYTIEELTRAALRDAGRYLSKEVRKMVPVFRGVLKRCVGVWVKKNRSTGQVLLQMGVYSNKKAKEKGLTPAYHAHLVQFGYEHVGSGHVNGVNYLDSPVYKNIQTIQQIESQYLSALSDENEALSLIQSTMDKDGEADENEY